MINHFPDTHTSVLVVSDPIYHIQCALKQHRAFRYESHEINAWVYAFFFRCRTQVIFRGNAIMIMCLWSISRYGLQLESQTSHRGKLSWERTLQIRAYYWIRSANTHLTSRFNRANTCRDLNIQFDFSIRRYYIIPIGNSSFDSRRTTKIAEEFMLEEVSEDTLLTYAINAPRVCCISVYDKGEATYRSNGLS